MKKRCGVATAAILAGILTACGQQRQEGTGMEPVQVYTVEEAGEEEKGTQMEEQLSDVQFSEEKDAVDPENGKNAGADEKENSSETGNLDQNGRNDQNPEIDSMETDQGSSGEVEEDIGEPEKAQDSENEISNLYGTWQVVDYRACQIYALSQQEIDEFLTYRVAYSKDGFALNGQSVEQGNFGYTFTDYAREDINQDFQVDLTEWWNESLSVPMGHIISGEGFFGETFFLADADKLWIYYEGVFFQAKKVDG